MTGFRGHPTCSALELQGSSRFSCSKLARTCSHSWIGRLPSWCLSTFLVVVSCTSAVGRLSDIDEKSLGPTPTICLSKLWHGSSFLPHPIRFPIFLPKSGYHGKAFWTSRGVTPSRRGFVSEFISHMIEPLPGVPFS